MTLFHNRTDLDGFETMKHARPSNARYQLTKSLLAFLVFALGAWSETSVASAEKFEEGNWQFRAAPYLWAVALDGEVTARGTTADVDASFSDIVENLNGAIMLLLEARRGPVSIFGDTIYAALESKNSSGPVSIKTDLDLLVFNFGIAYEAANFRLNEREAESPIRLSVEPIFGGRLFYLDTTLDPSRLPSISSSSTWVDPVFGMRLSSDITPNWNLRALGDVGGGVSSNLTWQAMALGGYRFGLFGEKDANAQFGYRAIYVDYDTGSGASRSGIDTTFHGPILGLEIVF